MPWIYSPGANPVSTTLTSSPSAGGTSFTIASAAGLPTVTAPFGTARIQAEGANTAEDIKYTRSGTTITLANATVLASAHASTAVINFDVMSQVAIDQFKDDAFSGYPENALAGAGALLSGGVMNHITIAAPATFTLADGVIVGQLCRIRIDRTSTAMATIDPAGSTTIDGLLTRIMWAGEVVYLAWNGTEWNRVAGRSIPMVCVIYMSTNLNPTVNGSVDTPVPVNTVELDNTGLMANVGANKITIQRPATYVVTGATVFSCALAAASNAQVATRQNSTDITRGVGSCGVNGFLTVLGAKSKTLAAADDIKLVYQHNAADTTPTLALGAAITYLSVAEQIGW